MASFKDKENRAWAVEINVAAIRSVKKETGVDLFRLTDAGLKGLGELLADPVAFVDVLYVLCRDQCEAKGLSDEQFGRAFSGDTIQQAADAFVDAVVDFFPDPKARSHLREVLSKIRETDRLLKDHGQKMLEQIDPAKLAAEIIAASKPSSGSSPASSESTPAPSP